MNRICSVLLCKKHKAGPAGNMFSLPEVDKQRKDKRTKPMGSPREEVKASIKNLNSYYRVECSTLRVSNSNFEFEFEGKKFKKKKS
jgi:hypothetical protein